VPVDPRYDDASIADDDRLLRTFSHQWYKPTLEPGESPAAIGRAGCRERMSSMGFQAMADKRSGVLGMSVYVERLLDPLDGPARLRAWREEVSGYPQSLVVIVAGSLRADSIGLGVMMDVVEGETFGEAHANVLYPQEGGKTFGSSLKGRLVKVADVLLP
jgi:hypothetical protein